MNFNIREERLSAFEGNPPASLATIREVEAALNLQLPEGYVQFLLGRNGGDGIIGTDFYAILWRVEELKSANDEYHAAEYLPGLLLFGSDGGGEALAFDMRSETNAVLSVPFVGMDLDVAEVLAPDFDAFLDEV